MSSRGLDFPQACDVVVPFRGERDYVHSTSIVNLLTPCLARRRPSHIAFPSDKQQPTQGAVSERLSGTSIRRCLRCLADGPDGTSAKVAFIESGRAIRRRERPMRSKRRSRAGNSLTTGPALRGATSASAWRIASSRSTRRFSRACSRWNATSATWATHFDWQGPLSPLGTIRLECHNAIGGSMVRAT